MRKYLSVLLVALALPSSAQQVLTCHGSAQQQADGCVTSETGCGEKRPQVYAH